MLERFCKYCGQPLEERCGCAREAAEEADRFIEEYENSEEVHAGWRNQDLIENSHFNNR